MSKFSSTYIMAGLVALLAAYTFYEYKHADKDEEASRGEVRLFDLVRDDIEQITLHGRGSEIVIKKAGDDWQMEKPVADRAESSAIEGFLYSLLTQKGKEFRSKDEAKDTNWKDYGLDPVPMYVEIQGKGKTEKVEVASKNAFDGSFYIRSKGELLLGDRGIAQLIEREPKSMRSRRLYRKSEDPKKVEVQFHGEGGSKSYSFLKGEDGKWAMEPKPDHPVDSDKIKNFVTTIKGFTATEIVSDTMSDEDRRNYLLLKPLTVISFDDWNMTVGQSKAEDIFLYTNKNPFIYKTSAANLREIAVGPEFFRNGRAPFKLEMDLVREIDIQTKDLKASFVKKESSWTSKNELKDKVLDEEKLVELVRDVQNLDAKEFFKTSVQTGWPSVPQVSLKDKEGKIVFAVTWGGEFKPKQGPNKDVPMRYVRTSQGREIFGLQKDKVDHLIKSDILKKKPVPENKTASSEKK
ncbi:MAG: DUF4340 domain-containing protein [Bdellovibrionales bacterium]